MTNHTISLHEVLNGYPAYQAQALSVKDAQGIIQKCITPIKRQGTLPLNQGLGRVLADDIVSPMDVPAHDNSAMDGYAFCGETLDSSTELSFHIVGQALAGHPFSGTVSKGECVKIMTGAMLPAGCNTVIPQELVKLKGSDSIQFSSKAVHLGDNRRFRGEDLAQGTIALAAGTTLGPAELGLLASLGITSIMLKEKLRVAYFSTGDEIRSPGEKLDIGCIYDSNRYTIFGMLSRLGCEVIDLGVIADHPHALEAALHEACERADAIITSGGVSVGAADYTRQVVAKLGEVEFWNINMRPGRPMAFGQITSNGHSAYLFGLPGNPVAVMATFYFFVRNALRHQMGALPSELILVPATSLQAIRKRPGRTEYQRGIVHQRNGTLEVQITGAQGSGMLRSMVEANCMIVLDETRGEIKAGESVTCLLFEGFI